MFGKLKNLIGKGNSFKCASCGKVHDEWPVIAYGFPDSYYRLSDEYKKENVSASSDFCVISYPEQIDRFVKVNLIQKVNGSCQDLQYGLWVSLSEKSFMDYKVNYNNKDYEAVYFGWICNTLAGYDGSYNVPANVVARTDGMRPLAIPHISDDNPLARDFHQGISKAEAQERIRNVLSK